MRNRSFLLLSTLGHLAACSHTPSNDIVSDMASSTHDSAQKVMTCIGPNVYVDTAMSKQQQQQFLTTVKQSRLEISRFFGGMQSSPKIYGCVSKKCFSRFGGISAKAKSIDDNTVILSKKGLDKITLSHELAHVELHKRLGSPHVWNKVPMWFDEGLAVMACNDPRYRKQVPSSSNKQTVKLDDLVTQNQWVRAVRGKKPAYSVARHAVASWYQSAGKQGLQSMILRMKKGESFSFKGSSVKTQQVSSL